MSFIGSCPRSYLIIQTAALMFNELPGMLCSHPHLSTFSDRRPDPLADPCPLLCQDAPLCTWDSFCHGRSQKVPSPFVVRSVVFCSPFIFAEKRNPKPFYTSVVHKPLTFSDRRCAQSTPFLHKCIVFLFSFNLIFAVQRPKAP